MDASVEPDIIADLTDLSAIPDGSADAVWASHCLEHLYEHQVTVALAEFRRVLGAEGFVPGKAANPNRLHGECAEVDPEFLRTVLALQQNI